MLTELFWIPTSHPGRLAMAPRPRGGEWLDDEMRNWRERGIDVVVSLLAREEEAEFELEEEAAACAARDIRYRSFPIPDREVPASRSDFGNLVSEVSRELAAGRSVAIHCRQGIGRSALVAAGVLIARGLGPEAAVARISAARGRPVPETTAQRLWLDEFARESMTAVST